MATVATAAPPNARTHASASQPASPLVGPESLDQGFTLVVLDKSKRASAQSPIYLASNHGGWNSGSPGMKLEPRSDMRWQIILPKPKDAAPLEFKFTRGSWDEVEVAADLADIGNRRLAPIDVGRLAPGERPVIELSIERWADERPNTRPSGDDPYRALSVTGTVRRVQIVGGGGATSDHAEPSASNASTRTLSREALVWLPPGYDAPVNSSRRYPVLYLMDGQNVFETGAAPVEWQADETATKLIQGGAIAPLIIVAIPHAGKRRTSEYLPVRALEGVEPGGDEFVSFLVERVMPRIDRAFRTRPGAEHTVIGGASLGATISLHAALRHPRRFGGVLLESMPTLSATSAWSDYLRSVERWPAMVWIAMGSAETGDGPESAGANAALVASARALEDQIMRSSSPTAVRLEIGQGDHHDERAWARRLPAALEFFFPAGH